MTHRSPLLRIAAVGALLGVAGALFAGCGRREPRNVEGKLARAKKRAKDAAQSDTSSLQVRGTGNAFTVDDVKGRRILEAKVGKMGGTVLPGSGLSGPVKMIEAECRLFQDGKPQMDLQSGEAVWDGKQLVTHKPAHGVTADGKTVIDAEKAVWTADTGHLALDRAKLQARKKKDAPIDFTAEGPKAEVENKVVLMPAGAVAANSEGQQLTAQRMRWNLETERLEATGNVVVRDTGTRVHGQRLQADTKLKRGRMSGRTRVHMDRLPAKTIAGEAKRAKKRG